MRAGFRRGVFGTADQPSSSRGIEVEAIGLDRIVILAALAEPSKDLDRSNRLLVEEVLPAVRG